MLMPVEEYDETEGNNESKWIKNTRESLKLLGRAAFTEVRSEKLRLFWGYCEGNRTKRIMKTKTREGK